MVRTGPRVALKTFPGRNKFTSAGRELKDHIEAVTDRLAAPAYDCLEPAEIDQLIADLEPLVARIDAVGYEGVAPAL